MKLQAQTRLVSAIIIVVASLLPLRVNAGGATPGNFAELYKNISPSVVTVKTQSYKISASGIKVSPGIGTGVLIQPTLIITAAHVIDDVDAIQVVFKDQTKIKAEPLAILKKSDVALIRLAKPHPNPVLAQLGDSDTTPIGSSVFVIGSPFGIQQTLSVGILSGRTNKKSPTGNTAVDFLYTDAAINPGNSGGPMFNEKGEVIGIVSFILTKSGGFEGIGFAASINTAYSSLMNSSAYVAGLDGVALTPTQARVLNLPERGLLVQRVVDESVTDKLGLKAGKVRSRIGEQDLLLGGDIITSIECTTCEKSGKLADVETIAHQLLEPDVVVTVYRDRQYIKLSTDPEPWSAYENKLHQKEKKFPEISTTEYTVADQHPVLAEHF